MIGSWDNKDTLLLRTGITVELLSFLDRYELVMLTVNDKGWLADLSNLDLVQKQAFFAQNGSCFRGLQVVPQATEVVGCAALDDQSTNVILIAEGDLDGWDTA